METKDVVTREALERALLLTLTDIKNQDDLLQLQVDELLNDKANNILSNYINKGDSSDITTTDTVLSAFSKVENKLEDKLDSNDTFTFVCTL